MSRRHATFRELPGTVPGLRRFRLDCPHGTTIGDVAGDPRSDLVILDLLLAQHELEEGCRCATRLRPRTSEARA